MSRHFECNMELYVFENYKDRFPDLSGSELTNKLILKSLSLYGVKVDKVLRTPKGKPYVKQTEPREVQEDYTDHADPGEIRSLHFSVSHSEDLFVCAVCDRPIGIDIQKFRNVKTEKISRRYFTENENEYLKTAGQDGFFFLWTRKEAYCKYTGTGLAEIIKGTTVLDRDDVEFIDFEIEKGMYCSCCIKK